MKGAMSMALRRTPLRNPYLKDVDIFVRRLHPDICQHFIDWCCAKFDVGQDLYIANSYDSSMCYNWNHSGVSTPTGQKWHPVTRRTENAAISRWAQEQKNISLTPCEVDEAVSAVTLHRQAVKPTSCLGLLLGTYTAKGEQYAMLWEKHLKYLAKLMAEEVSKAYIQSYPSEATRFLGIKAMQQQESAPGLFTEAMEGNKAAVEAMQGWFAHLPGDLQTITLVYAQGVASCDAQDVMRNRRRYQRYRESLIQELKQEAFSIPLTDMERQQKFYSNNKTEIFARLMLRLSPRQLALVTWAKRISTDGPMYASLSRPIKDEVKKALTEARARHAPMDVIFNIPEFTIDKKECAV